MYVNVIVDITHEKLDKIFQYSIPSELEGMLEVGMEILVPFGRGNKEIKGYVIGFSEQVDYDADKIKAVLGIAQQGMAIESKLVALAAWMREYYGGTMIQALKTVLPIKKKEKEKEQKILKLLLDKEQAEERLEYFLSKNQKARARLLAALLDEPQLSYSLVAKKLNITASVVQALEAQGILKVESQVMFRNPHMADGRPRQEIHYTLEQQYAIESFWAAYKAGQRDTWLIHGITGSGKTEVYMEMIRRVVDMGKQAIVLIPEIALTYQMVMNFYRRFGDRVSIMNSRMSAGERYDQMQRAKMGDVDVMIGPRSALFTPFPNLGLIIIDEEHETTYKSEQVPRYHARETAVKRAQLEDACVVLGSATPSLEAYYRCQMGQYRLLELSHRAKEQPLPRVYTVDMRQELRAGNRSIFSDKLREKMEERLEKGQQTMLFINRRGYAGFVSCRSCGEVIKCPHCDVSLAAHNNGKLVCHYCGYETKQVTECPVCGSSHVGGFRAGTQQIEMLIQKAFPQARVLRMDMDTTKHKDGHEKILAAFANEEADILVGTQMIVKGHDFPNVTLVGVLAADMSLYANDYRSGERTFQLLTQAAGRAGRGREKGEVVIQTYSPDHYSIQTAANQDYQAFYQREMEYRELMGYPPAEHLLAILMAGSDEKHLELAANYLKDYAVRVDKEAQVAVIGPATPYIGKVNDIYRKIIYLKSSEYDILIRMKNFLERYIEINTGFQKVRIQFDFNPMNIF